MLKHIKRNDIGHVIHDWLDTYHHFSFATYYNSERMGFGPLRVVNDDYIKANTGFELHPHKDMEIITYIIDGELTHNDTLGNDQVITKGHVQYMSAGTGIWHSEKNNSDKNLRLLQIWVLPDKNGHKPNYGEKRFDWNERVDKWLHIVSNYNGDGVIKVNQDVNFYVIETNKDFTFDVEENRQAYIVNIDGSTTVNGIQLNLGDALEVVEEKLKFKPETRSHVLVIEMKKM